MHNAIDGGLESAIRVFYVRRDGHDIAPIPYLAKERDRVRSTMSWIESQLRGSYCTEEAGFGLSEIALVTAIGWMRFRQAYPVDDHPQLAAFYDAWASRPSVQETLPAEGQGCSLRPVGHLVRGAHRRRGHSVRAAPVAARQPSRAKTRDGASIPGRHVGR